MKQCPKCQVQIPNDQIVNHSYLCKKCTAENARWRHIKASYGLSKEDYNALFESQGFKCAICGSSKQDHSKMFNFCVDHEHDSAHKRGTKDRSKIRGILCNNCNHGIGKFKDDPELLRNAINYLEIHKG